MSVALRCVSTGTSDVLRCVSTGTSDVPRCVRYPNQLIPPVRHHQPLYKQCPNLKIYHSPTTPQQGNIESTHHFPNQNKHRSFDPGLDFVPGLRNFTGSDVHVGWGIIRKHCCINLGHSQNVHTYPMMILSQKNGGPLL